MLFTERDEERILNEQAERTRLAAAAEQRERAVSQFTANQQTIKAMMTQFDLLMGEGVYNTLYNGGMGNISAATAPFYQARILAQQARSLMHKGTLPYSDEDPAPYAGMFVSTTMGFLSQELQFEALKEYRYMLTHARRDTSRGPLPRRPDHRVSRRRAVAEPVRAADRQVRQGRRRLRPRSQDQADPREARSVDPDELPQRDPARRHSQVHQAGHPGAPTTRASRSTSIRSASRKPIAP